MIRDESRNRRVRSIANNALQKAPFASREFLTRPVQVQTAKKEAKQKGGGRTQGRDKTQQE